jgi:TonB family protein
MLVTAILPLLVKATALLLAAWLVTAALRRASAAARHFVWLACFAALLLLPVTLWLTPAWQVTPPQALAPVLAAGRTVITVTAGEAKGGPEISFWLLMLWAAGAGGLLARGVRSQVLAARLVRSAEPHLRYHGLPVKISTHVPIPLVCGLRSPVILLPAGAGEWPRERIEVVLRHEAAHAARRDPLAQAAASLACALYWPLPWVWAAARRMAVEAEFACDDCVLATGPRASEYATHLIEIVRSIQFDSQIPEGGIPMARISDLDHRLRAMFHANTNRLPAGRRFMLAVATAAFTLLIPLAGVRTPLFAFSDGISGVVKDPSGAVVPRARVIVQFTSEARREMVYTNDAGEFTAAPLPDGDYIVSVEKPGFAALKLVAIPVGPGHTSRLELTLQTGRVKETLNVAGAGAPALSPVSEAGDPKRIRVGGNVQSTKMIKQARPAYPPGCKAEGIQGTVMLRAVISKEGSILNLEPINKLVDSRLVQSAIDAVKQWQYQPTLLNGQPVEVITEIDINFTLAP